MPALPITPPPTARAATAPKGASPPTRPDGDFAALLDETSARTAVAEGPKSPPTEPRHHGEGEGEGEASKDEAAPISPDAGPSLAVALPAVPQDGGQPPVPAAPIVAQAVPAPTVDAAAAAAAASAPPVSPAPPAPAVTAATSVVAPPASAQTAVATVDPELPKDTKSTDASATPAADAPADKLQIPAELLAPRAEAKPDQGKDFKNDERPARDLPPAPTLPPTADAAATPAPAPAPAPASASAATAPAAPAPDPGASAPAPAVAPTATTQAQPAATVQTAVPVASGGVGGAVLTRASVLQTAERVHELVRIATTRAGNARATLQLRPAELGQVDVHLRTTRDGLVATISAHDQVGHDALQQAGNELRRSLEDKGVQLHSLDLQLGAGRHDFSNRGDAREAASGRRGAASTYGLDSDDTVAEDTLTITHAPSTPAGALVDVRA